MPVLKCYQMNGWTNPNDRLVPTLPEPGFAVSEFRAKGFQLLGANRPRVFRLDDFFVPAASMTLRARVYYTRRMNFGAKLSPEKSVSLFGSASHQQLERRDGSGRSHC